MRGGRPLVGRAREVADLAAALEASILGRGALFLLVGEAGIGKSRLSEELAENALARGAAVCFGRCWEAGGAPAFWPWVEILRSLLNDVPDEELPALLGPGASDIVQLVPEIAARAGVSSPSPLAPVAERFRLFDAVTGFLARRSSTSPSVLILEDLHAADPPTLQLLAFVAQRTARSRLLLVGTYRDVEARFSPEIAEIIAKIGRTARTLQLEPLDRDAVRELVEKSDVGVTSAELVDRIYRTTEGNPLFIDELVRLYELRGADMPGALPIPDGVRGAIRERLRLLDPATRSLLEVAAAAGREFSLALVAEAAGRPAAEAHSLLLGASRAGLLAETDIGRFVFSHVLVRDVLHDELDELRRSELHLAMADILERFHASDPAAPLAEIAHHLTRAGPAVAPRALAALEAASRRSMALLAFEDAVALLERALGVLELVAPGDARRRFHLLLEIGRAQIRAGGGPRAKEVCLAAAAIARELRSEELLAEAALTLGKQPRVGQLDEELIALLRDALTALPDGGSSTRARLMARLAAALQPARDPGVPIQMAAEAADMARRVGSESELLEVLDWAGAAFADLAPAEQRLSVDQETLALAERLGENVLAFRAHRRLFWDRMELADLEAADEHVRAIDRLAAEFRQPHLLWVAPCLRMVRAVLEGRFEDAERERSKAKAIAARAQDPTIELSLGFSRVATAFTRGDQAGLRAAMQHFPGDVFDPAYEGLVWALMRAWCTVRSGGTVTQDLAELLPPEMPLTYAALTNRLALADICYVREDRELAARLYPILLADVDRLDIWGMPGLGCVGPAERGLVVVAATLGRWEDAERHFRSARALAEKIGARPSIALMELDYALALAKRGRPEDAPRIAELARSAAGIARALGMKEHAERCEALLGRPNENERSFGQGRYVVRRELGRGGQKTVYLVHDEALGRECALAWIDSADLDPKDAQRLRAEARMLARMKPHPNIVTVFDIGEEDGRPFVVSEHVAGGDLAEEIARGPIPMERALSIVRALLGALTVVHRQGIVHRDLKPANVWLDDSGQPKIGDFGVALVADRARRTMSGIVNATAEYASPEQLMNDEVDGRSDLYSLGCLMYELLTGRTPFLGTLVTQISQHVHAAPSPPSNHNPAVRPAIDRFVLRLLAKAPEDRPGTAQDALQELDAISATEELGSLQAQKLASLSELVAGIAHEINTPLGALQANVDVLQRAFGILSEALQDEEVGDLLRRNQRVQRALSTLERTRGVNPDATKRIARIVRDLKSFARLDQAHEESADLRELLESAIAVLPRDFGERIEVVREYAEVPKFRCKPQEMNQVFFNVLMNAIQAIPAHGTITVSTSMDGSDIVVRIADSGTGIAKEHLPRIFDPGFTTKGVGVGVGLGLSIAYRIVDAHGGTIAAESEPGRGSAFTIRLPA